MKREGVAAAGEADLLDRVALAPAEIPHPADLLTVEQAATQASVSVSTVDSAIPSAEEFRGLVFEETIRTLPTEPGDSVWAALQETVSGPDLTLGPVLGARAQELAEDPALPLYLSGFERLDDPGMELAVNDVLCKLVVDLWPFVQTIYSAFGEPCPLVPSAEIEFVGLLHLLSDALRRSLLPDQNQGESQKASDLLAELLVEAVSTPVPSTGARLFPQVDPTNRRMIKGVGREATDAAVQLLRSGLVEPTTTLSVADAAERCEVSVSRFYRTFNSMADFELRLFQRAGRSLTSNTTLKLLVQEIEHTEVRNDSSEHEVQAHENTIPLFIRRVTRHQQHNIANGRPGLELLPWLQTLVLGPVVRQSVNSRFAEVGQLIDRLYALTGAQSAADMNGADAAAVFATQSMVFELLVRNSPNYEASSVFKGPEDSSFIEKMFKPVGR